MIKFSGPYPLDYLYLKSKRNKLILSIPLCEAINGRFDKDKSDRSTVVLVTEHRVTGVPDITTTKKADLKTILEKALGVGEIQDFAIQPEGEMMTSDIVEFMTKYSV